MKNGYVKKGLVLGILFLFVGAGIVSGTVIDSNNIKTGSSEIKSNYHGNTIYVDDDNTDGPWDGSSAHPYQFIQDGVDNASNGDTILVQDGYYTENIVIDKSISLLGENNTNTIIYGSYTGDVVNISADSVTFNHFTAKSGGINSGDSCIKLYNSSGINNCLIRDNVLLNSNIGVYLWNADFNRVIENQCYSNHEMGIKLYYAHENNVLDNEVWSNYYVGIKLGFLSNHNNIKRNKIYENDHGISTIDFSNENNITENIVFNNTINGIWLADLSRKNTVKGNQVFSNYNGIEISCVEYDDAENHIIKNTVYSNNERGIFIWRTNRNRVVTNHVFDNPKGIELVGSCNANIIYDNSFVNTINAIDDGTNGWCIEVEPGPNIINGPLISGNYWDDYSGADNNGDGFGDTLVPYDCSGNIQTGGDTRPLVDNQFNCIFKGPSKGRINEELTYIASATAPNNENVWFFIDWADGNIEEWIGPYNSGENIEVPHIWDEEGKFTIMVKAKDMYNYESEKTFLEISIPRTRAPFNSIWLCLMERLPIISKILNMMD
jgi:parallel beta-helix repeat protein